MKVDRKKEVKKMKEEKEIKIIGWNGHYYIDSNYVVVLEIEGKPLRVAVVREDREDEESKENYLCSCGNRAVPLLLNYLGSEQLLQELADKLASINEGGELDFIEEVCPEEEYGYVPTSKKLIKVGVCKGRHEMPCDMFVFENTIEDPTDTLKLESDAEKFFDANFPIVAPDDILEVYVTGLTVALIAVLKIAIKKFKRVHLKHFDTKSGLYYTQTL